MKAILGRGTKLMYDIGSSIDKWSSRAFDWYCLHRAESMPPWRFGNNSKRGIEHHRILFCYRELNTSHGCTNSPTQRFGLLDRISHYGLRPICMPSGKRMRASLRNFIALRDLQVRSEMRPPKLLTTQPRPTRTWSPFPFRPSTS